MEYKILDFKVGKYAYDTIFIVIDDKDYQIPIKKGICTSDLIGQEVMIENLYIPIENI